FPYTTLFRSADLRHGDLLLAPQHKELPDALLLLFVDVVGVAVGSEGAGEDPEQGEAPDVRVGDGLEHQRRQGASGVGRAGHFLAVARVSGLTGGCVGGRRKQLYDAVQERLDADRNERRPEADAYQEDN